MGTSARAAMTTLMGLTLAGPAYALTPPTQLGVGLRNPLNQGLRGVELLARAPTKRRMVQLEGGLYMNPSFNRVTDFESTLLAVGDYTGDPNVDFVVPLRKELLTLTLVADIGVPPPIDLPFGGLGGSELTAGPHLYFGLTHTWRVIGELSGDDGAEVITWMDSERDWGLVAGLGAEAWWAGTVGLRARWSVRALREDAYNYNPDVSQTYQERMAYPSASIDLLVRR